MLAYYKVQLTVGDVFRHNISFNANVCQTFDLEHSQKRLKESKKIARKR